MARLTLRGVVLVIVAAAVPALAAEAFDLRGVVFGPYGRPWSHADRMEMIRWMARPDVGMNVYVHAPKNDVHQRLQWRDGHPAGVLDEMLEEVALGASLGVAWVPNLSPGVPLIPSPRLPSGLPSRDVCFSCPEDLDRIVAIFAPFFDAGARTFMLSFDDVQKVSTHPEDALAFGAGDEAYGRMNADLLNRLLERLESLPRSDAGPVRLLTVPADYSGTARTPYLAGFGALLDCRIRVMWTGTAVVSHEIRKEDAALFREAVFPAGGRCDTQGAGRPKLLLWDNFPVNDYAGNVFSGNLYEGFAAGEEPVRIDLSAVDGGFTGPALPTGFKLNLGPYKGRRSDLPEEVDGILANPMSEAEASKIPLYTVAAYLRDPAGYTDAPVDCPEDPDSRAGELVPRESCLAERAWIEGIAAFGGAAAAAVLDFANQVRSTPLDRTESPVFERLRDDLLAAWPTPFWSEARHALAAELGREEAAPVAIRASPAHARFAGEARHHLAQLEENARVGLLAASLLAAERPALAIRVVAPHPGGGIMISGTAAPPDLVLATRLLAALLPPETAMRASPWSVHGDRFQHDLGTVYFRENRMDAFTGSVHELTAAWLARAPLAAAGPLSLTVDGEAAPVGADGSFEAIVPAAPVPRIVEVVVTDAAGGTTGERVAVGP